jgi:Spy/CpxP family protein refolding chaperone
MSPRLLVLLLCFVNLVAGTAIGVVVDRTLLIEKGRGSSRRGERPDMTRMLEKKLELDAEQVKKVREIFAAARPQFEAAMKEARPRMEQIRQESDAQIRAILRPEQQTKFDDVRREWQQKHEGRERRERGDPASVNTGTKAETNTKEGVK